jgi:2-dehydro-3-deoxyphosphogluconate aldolase / (4S)-4-hydroxy-2-oxoglutarate aldolase
MNVTKFKKLPILGIIRGIEYGAVEPLMETCISAGLETVEITMNTKDAAKLIKRAVAVSGKKLTIGAGTVLNIDSLKSAIDAGATFIVMPALVDEVVNYCAKLEIPVFPGALTPQEILNAWNAGATMVKVFPSGFFGPEYFKEIKGPFDEIELLACGGVTPENMREYFSNGASAVSFGGDVFKKDFKSIGESIKRYIVAYK